MSRKAAESSGAGPQNENEILMLVKEKKGEKKCLKI